MIVLSTMRISILNFLAVFFLAQFPCVISWTTTSRHRVCRIPIRLASSTMNNPQTMSNTERDSAIDNSKSVASLEKQKRVRKLQGKLLKKMRNTCRDYDMLQDGDHLMVCVSGGKDSAVLLYLLKILQEQLPVKFEMTIVHVDQKQPGYDGRELVEWLDNDMKVRYKIVEEDTYSVVKDKTSEGKSYCTVCSRLRRGILYSTALELGCNKICLGHHADDCLETLFLNMMHGGQLKGMPARYTSKRGNLGVLRPLMECFEDDIAEYAALQEFPILPCNLCKNQPDLHRPQVKLLLQTLEATFTPTAKQNMLRSLSDIRPSHLLDQSLREQCGMDPITGEETSDDHEPL